MPSGEQYSRLLAGVWLGMLVCTARQVRRILRHASLVRLAKESTRAAHQRNRSGRHRSRSTASRALVTAGIGSPFVWFLGRLRLVWPETMSGSTQSFARAGSSRTSSPMSAAATTTWPGSSYSQACSGGGTRSSGSSAVVFVNQPSWRATRSRSRSARRAGEPTPSSCSSFPQVLDRLPDARVGNQGRLIHFI